MPDMYDGTTVQKLLSKINNPHFRESFIVNRALTNMIDIETGARQNISKTKPTNLLETYIQTEEGYTYDSFIKHYLTNITNEPLIMVYMSKVEFKSTYDIDKQLYIIHPDFIGALKREGFKLIGMYDRNLSGTLIEYMFIKDGVYLIFSEQDSGFICNLKISKNKTYSEKTYIHGIKMYYTKSNSNPTPIDVFINILNIMDKNSRMVIDNEDDVKLSMITENRFGGYQLETRTISNGHEFNNIDIHYGEGFEESYNNLIKVASENKKGLIIFHGDPGTGKTYCITDFIRQVKNKKPIYINSQVFAKLTEPGFISFLLDESDILSESQTNLLFIVEDSENLIIKRDSGHMTSDGISNLLNSTDGLLNGMINIQALLTFNTDINNIDQALLRNERLIGHMEFGKISKDRVEKLVDLLGIETLPDDFYDDTKVVADVYALLKQRETISYKLPTNTKDFIL